MPTTEERSEKLAINLFDVDHLDPWFRRQVLAGKLDLGHPLKTDWDRVATKDEVAVVFTCGLLEAALTCDLVRNHNRQLGDWPCRLYIKKKTWTRIPSYRVLTVLGEDSKAALNRQVFPVEVTLEEVVPLTLATRPVVFGSNNRKG